MNETRMYIWIDTKRPKRMVYHSLWAIHMIMIIITAAQHDPTSLPRQPPLLVCHEISLFVAGYRIPQLDQNYCNDLHDAVCLGKDFSGSGYGSLEYPFYLLENDSGRYRGNGVAFDVYGTMTLENHTYKRFPFLNSFEHVNRSELLEQGAWQATSSKASGSRYGIFYYAPCSIVLQYSYPPSTSDYPVMDLYFNSVRNTSGINCSSLLTVYHDNEPELLASTTTTNIATILTTPPPSTTEKSIAPYIISIAVLVPVIVMVILFFLHFRPVKKSSLRSHAEYSYVPSF